MEFTKKKVVFFSIMAVFIIILILLGVFFGMFIVKEATRPKESDDPQTDMFSLNDFNIVDSPTTTYEGYLPEAQSQRYDYYPPLDTGDLMRWIMVTVTWRDEEDYSQGVLQYTNEPDSFSVSGKWEGGGGEEDPILIATGADTNVHDGEGRAYFELLVTHRQKASNKGSGLWNITVHMSVAGDHKNVSEKVRTQPDEGNSFTCVIESEIYKLV
jgi:hypothetical protein